MPLSKARNRERMRLKRKVVQPSVQPNEAKLASVQPSYIRPYSKERQLGIQKRFKGRRN